MKALALPVWARSLRFRLLAATLVALLVALVLAGLLLAGLFRDHVLRQFGLGLQVQLDELTTRLEFGADGLPQLDTQPLTDPRWSRPYSGLYWQVQAVPGPGANAQPVAEAAPTVLRSRSLWDAVLTVPNDEVADGAVHVHHVAGPDGQRLLLVERSVRPALAAGAAPMAVAAPSWRLLVAGDLADTEAAVAGFNGRLLVSLAALLLLLCLAALAQVAVGLAPLRALQRALAALRDGQAQRLDGQFPQEVQPLINDFNAVLQRNAQVVDRARTQAGNLAHALKTPLAALAQAADDVLRADAADAAGGTLRAGTAAAQATELATLVQDQVASARRHVDWHLARARVAAAHGLPGARCALAPAMDGLLRVMARVHAHRGVAAVCAPLAPGLAFAGELQDLQEVLGNLLDNAFKWARGQIQISAVLQADAAGRRLRVLIDDDGPGIAEQGRAAVLARGARLDESVAGSGLGLAIVHELVGLYGGSLQLAASPLGGLQVQLVLPAA